MPIGDIPMYFLCSLKGNFAMIPEEMAVRRYTGEGEWTGRKPFEHQKIQFKIMETLFKVATGDTKKAIRKNLKVRSAYFASMKFPEGAWKRNATKMFFYTRDFFKYGPVR